MREKRRIQFFAKTKTFPNEIYEKENAKAPIFLASGLSYCILKIGEHQCVLVHFNVGSGINLLSDIYYLCRFWHISRLSDNQ